MKNNNPVSLYRQIAISFAGITMGLILLILYFAVSYAWITIVPETEEIRTEFIETVSEEDETEGVVGRIVQTEISGKKNFTVPSKKTDQVGRATGSILVYNKSDEDMTLIPTTRFLSKEGVLFRLKERIHVASGSHVEAEVYADEPGEKGDINPTTFSVPGLGTAYEGIVYGESEEPMSGGVVYDAWIQQSDIDKAKQSLKDELTHRAFVLLEDQQRTGEVLFQEASHVTVLSEQVSAKAGDNKPQFSVDMNLRIQVLFSNELKMFELAKAELRRVAGADMELVSAEEKDLSFTLEKYDRVARSAQIKVTLTGQGILRRTSSILDQEELMGLKAEQVKQYLEAQPGIKEVKVEFSPFWVRRVPKLKDHIKIRVQKEI